MEKQVINLDNDYIKKVQAGILLPKKQHENFELIKGQNAEHLSRLDNIEKIVEKILDSLNNK